MKNDVVDADNKRKSVDFQLLESYTNTVKPTIATVTPRKVKRLKADPTTPNLPSPLNGIQYTKVEVMDILSKKQQTAMTNYKSHDNFKPCTLWKGYYLSNAERQEKRKSNPRHRLEWTWKT